MAAVEPIELPITANTDRFARKLRLIAKAYADLADALEAIDNEGQQPPLDPSTHAHAFPYEPGSEPPLITGDCECGMTYEEYRRECEKDPWWSGTEARTIAEARVIDQARAATGEITATATCACGREIHLTVALPARDIEAAVKRVLLGMQRDAMQWAARSAPIGR